MYCIVNREYTSVTFIYHLFTLDLPFIFYPSNANHCFFMISLLFEYSICSGQGNKGCTGQHMLVRMALHLLLKRYTSDHLFIIYMAGSLAG